MKPKTLMAAMMERRRLYQVVGVPVLGRDAVAECARDPSRDTFRV